MDPGNWTGDVTVQQVSTGTRSIIGFEEGVLDRPSTTILDWATVFGQADMQSQVSETFEDTNST